MSLTRPDPGQNLRAVKNFQGVHLVRTSTSHPGKACYRRKSLKVLWFNRKKDSFGAEMLYFTIELIIFRFFHEGAK